MPRWIADGACELEVCTLVVLATVVSRPTPDRTILDPRYKALTSDLLDLDGRGLIADHNAAKIAALSAEHGNVKLGASGRQPVVVNRQRSSRTALACRSGSQGRLE